MLRSLKVWNNQFKLHTGEDGDAAGGVSVVEKVSAIVGITPGHAASENVSFENLGVDSLQFMEIQNVIKKVSGQKIAIEKLNKMTIKALRALQEESSAGK